MPLRKIVTYNVNGIRAAIGKSWMEWLQSSSPDIVCLQEIKISDGIMDDEPFVKLGYQCYWHTAEKKGYSGVAILTRIQPDKITFGSGNAEIDREGRIIRADYGDVSVISVYIPSGTTGAERQDYKMKWLDWFGGYLKDLRKKRPQLILAGDFNICHKAIDIHNPVSNAKSSGFLPDERAWMENFFHSGFVDTFRHFNNEPHQYTWWSFRFNARARNLGWRIDYLAATENLKSQLKRCVILPEVVHSDHCPVLLEVEF